MWSPVTLPSSSPVYLYEEDNNNHYNNILTFDSDQPSCTDTILIANQQILQQTMQNFNQNITPQRFEGRNPVFGNSSIDQEDNLDNFDLPSLLSSSGEESVDIFECLARLEGEQHNQLFHLTFPPAPAYSDPADSKVETRPRVEDFEGIELDELVSVSESNVSVGIGESLQPVQFTIGFNNILFGSGDVQEHQLQQTINTQDLLVQQPLEYPFLLTVEDNATAPVKVEKSISGRRQLKAPPPSKQSVKETINKSSPEYLNKRERNNLSVQKSREKARLKQQETERRVQTLTSLNSELQERVKNLEQELSVLKGLFTNIGTAIPQGLK